jgi:starch synthase
MAYDGHFSHGDFTSLSLPPEWWSPEYVEFYGGFSMLKAGLVFSDQVTTVSPTYAREICTTEFGYRFEGILEGLGDRLTGILNGIDLDLWNPGTDKHLVQNYSIGKKWLANKHLNKQHLLEHAGFKNNNQALLGFIGRLVDQKGVDLILGMLPELFATTDVSVIVLGSGDRLYETELKILARKHPDRLFVHIGYSEDLAHKVEAGSDMFLMPSRFEPCGLNQMYSLRYGTPPIVTNTGGLADTVTDTTSTSLNDKTANGFKFNSHTPEALLETVNRALLIYQHQPEQWQQVCETAMRQELGWETSAKEYQSLYQQA